MAQIFTHSRWHSATTEFSALEARGIKVVQDVKMADLGLPPPNPGEVTVGQIEGQELTLLKALMDLNADIEATDRRMRGETMKKMGELIAKSDPTTPLVVADPAELRPDVADDAFMEDYFAKTQTVKHIHATLHFVVGERLGAHRFMLGFRAGGKVVNMGERPVGR